MLHRCFGLNALLLDSMDYGREGLQASVEVALKSNNLE
jgi:hypothetical protein